MQVICDVMVSTDVVAGWPGSVHDSRVLRNSAVSYTAANKFPGNTHLLGDGGYPLHTWLITPYRDTGHLTADETFFNSVLSSNRQTVERSIKLLKGRWRKLQHLDHLKGTQSRFCACVKFDFRTGGQKIKTLEKWCRAVKNLFASSSNEFDITLKVTRI